MSMSLGTARTQCLLLFPWSGPFRPSRWLAHLLLFRLQGPFRLSTGTDEKDPTTGTEGDKPTTGTDEKDPTTGTEGDKPTTGTDEDPSRLFRLQAHLLLFRW